MEQQDNSGFGKEMQGADKSYTEPEVAGLLGGESEQYEAEAHRGTNNHGSTVKEEQGNGSRWSAIVAVIRAMIALGLFISCGFGREQYASFQFPYGITMDFMEQGDAILHHSLSGMAGRSRRANKEKSGHWWQVKILPGRRSAAGTAGRPSHLTCQDTGQRGRAAAAPAAPTRMGAASLRPTGRTTTWRSP